IDGVGRRRTPWQLMLVAALLVIVPFFAWYGTWFGRELSDSQIEEYLTDEKPRHVQHALAEIERRMAKQDAATRRWHPQIVALSHHPVADVRQTAAWVMGADVHAVEYHEALAQLLRDAEPIVRRNAALSLVSFGDAAGRPELLAMLRPYTINAPVEGKVLTILNEGVPVKREGLIARLRLRNDELYELRSPLSGKISKAFVREGDEVSIGREIILLSPDEAQVRNALIALSQVGEADDISEMESHAQETASTSAESKQVVKQAIEAIRKRSAEKR
ncbi:MAG: HEAT repeat domain-containing protein, partial [Acidobacteria bacterium]|nr:HEAT repeat domain-containing protein [Acidobacteriota bacterium]